MCKLWKAVGACAAIAAVLWLGGVVRDRQTLSEDVIRLHVVAASDSEEDQALKLRVRDAVIGALSDVMADCADARQARQVLEAHLELVRQVAQQTLTEAGITDAVCVSLTREEFDTRVYDTFTLPSGVYDSLRIVIGEGQGHNWWCVVFPKLCVPATVDDFEDTAVGSGFSDTLTDTVSNEKGHEIRFFFLDCLGMLQNLFHRG